MTTATATRRKKSSTEPSMGTSGDTSKRALAIAGALIVVGVIIALIIALASGGGDGADEGAALDTHIPQGSTRQVSFADVIDDGLPRFEAGTVDQAIGLDAPSFTASYFDNTETTIDPADGTPRIFMFLAHWCSHCQAEVDSITSWVEANGIPEGVEVIGISTSVDEGLPNYPASTWLLREGWPFPVLRDSAQNELAAGLGLSGTPFTVAVDGDGKVVSRSSGELAPGQWDALIAQLTG